MKVLVELDTNIDFAQAALAINSVFNSANKEEPDDDLIHELVPALRKLLFLLSEEWDMDTHAAERPDDARVVVAYMRSLIEKLESGMR